MRPECRSCGLTYEADSSGAMGVSYLISAAIALPLFFALSVHGMKPLVAIGIPTLILACITPFNIRYSRLGWLHITYITNPPNKDGPP